MKGAGQCMSMPNLYEGEICIRTKECKYENMLMYELLRFSLAQINYNDLYTIDEDVYYTICTKTTRYTQEVDTINEICDKLNKLSIFNDKPTSINAGTQMNIMMQSLLIKRLAEHTSLKKICQKDPFTFNNNVIIINLGNGIQINAIKIVTTLIPFGNWKKMYQVYNKTNQVYNKTKNNPVIKAVPWSSPLIEAFYKKDVPKSAKKVAKQLRVFVKTEQGASTGNTIRDHSSDSMPSTKSNLNDVLHGVPILENTFKEWQKYCKSQTQTRDFYVHRRGPLMIGSSGEMLSDKSNHIIQMAINTSTSVFKHIAAEFLGHCFYNILIPAQQISRILPIFKISAFPNEYEIIIPAGTFLRIDSILQTENIIDVQFIIKMTVVNPTYKNVMNPNNIIREEITKIETNQGTSIIYRNTSRTMYYKRIVKDDMEFNEMFKRGLNEMLAAYTYRELFGLNTFEYTMMYYPIDDVFVLCSKYKKEISIAEEQEKSKDPLIQEKYIQSFQQKMSEEFLVDCIMCNWDAYGECNTLIIDEKTFRVDVGGCLNYRAMGDERESIKTNINEHESIPIYNPKVFKFDDEIINCNIKLIDTAHEKFNDFRTNVMKKFTNMITNMKLPLGSASDYITFIENSIDSIRKRLLFYTNNGRAILNMTQIPVKILENSSKLSLSRAHG